MKVKALVVSLSLVSILLVMSQASFAQNLIVDPGFDLGITAPNPNPNGLPGWSTFGGPIAEAADANALSPPNDLQINVGGGGGYSVPGAFQNLAAVGGEQFTFSAYVYTPNVLVAGSNDFAILQLTFWTGGPPTGYGTGTGTNFTQNVGTPIGDPTAIPLPQGTWTFASVTATAPAGTNSVSPFLLDINADANAVFYFDNTSLTAVPEPASLSLLGMGLVGLGLVARRRFR